MKDKYYGAIPSRHLSDKWLVAYCYTKGDWHPVGNIRNFDTFDEADSVARRAANGEYPNLTTAGSYVAMR